MRNAKRTGIAVRWPGSALLVLLLIASGACDGPAPDSGGAEGSFEPALYDELDARASTWVDETLASLSLRERIAQLVVPWIPGAYASSSDASFRTLERWVEEEGIGGVVISIGSPHSYASLLNRLQNASRVPLLVTADFENGGPGMRVNHSYALPTLLPQGGGTSFPPTMAFGAIGDPAFAYEYGRITAVEARALGVHLNFAPVLDVNSNPENPIINTRAFGEDPEAVAQLGAAYIEGARAGGVLTTAKHFPGHGDTRTDSHIELPVVTADRGRLEAMELVPFRRAVSAGVDAVMTAHVAVPAILGGDVPATLSPFFLTELLREDMGFDGLVFTDALRMGAISRGYGAGEAAVLALEAGSDVLLVPEDVGEAIDAVEVAVRTGRVARERIDRSVRLLLAAKARVGLHDRRTVDIAAVADVAGSARHLTFADLAAERSVTLVRDRDGLVPLPAGARGRVVSVTYARDQDLVAGREFDRVAAHFADGFRSLRLDEGSDPAAYQAVQTAARDADVVLLNVYVPPFAGAGSVAVPDALRDMVRELSARGALVVSSFGNPYSLSAFDDLGSYLIAWGSHEVSQRAGAFALMGAAEISGTLPISIPPDHAAGDGLRREALPEPTAVREAVMAVPSWVVQPLEFVTAARAADDGQEAQGQISPLEGDPAEAGMSAAVLQALDRRILAAIADSASPGAALAIVRHGQLVRLRGYGRLDWDPASAPATPSSIYDMASVTKVMGTTTAAMILVDEGRLDLDAAVVRYLPWWSAGDPRKEAVTVRQLLLHRGGLPPFRRFFLEMEGVEAYQQAIAELPLDYAPGDSTVYSDIGMMTVAWAIEEITGQPLDRFLSERVWGPLGMQDTGFSPDSALHARVAPTEIDADYRGVHVRGVVHDENAWAVGGVAGHAGLFSSARDIAVFAAMMLDGGRAGPCDGTPAIPCSAPRPGTMRVVEPSTVDGFTRRHDGSASRATGWDTPSGNSSAGRFFTGRAFGHTGFTGPSVWIDPELDLAVVLLLNRVNPTRENTRHVPLRREIHDLAAQAVTDLDIEPRPPS